MPVWRAPAWSGWQGRSGNEPAAEGRSAARFPVLPWPGCGVDGHVCIHALYSMLPKVFAMMYNAEFPWAKNNPDTLTHPCPDAAYPVVFELTRIYED